MMSSNGPDTFVAEQRNDFGKGPARRLRVAGRIPAVMYGHGEQPTHVSLDGHDATLALRTPNALMNISLDGKEQLTIAKEVQRHPVKRIVEHVDLLIVKAGEKLSVEVPLVVEGEPAPGAVAQLDNTVLAVEAEATHIPNEIAVSVEGREIGNHVTAADATLPSGVSLVTAEGTVLVTISEPQENVVETSEEEPEGDVVDAAHGNDDAANGAPE